MRASIWAQILALPASLRLACAERIDDTYITDEALYDSGLGNQDVLGGVPCPDYTRYATQRQ